MNAHPIIRTPFVAVISSSIALPASLLSIMIWPICSFCSALRSSWRSIRSKKTRPCMASPMWGPGGCGKRWE